MSTTIIFLQSHEITTVQKLKTNLDETKTMENDLRNKIRSNDRRNAAIDAIIGTTEVVRELKLLHAQYLKIG